ncbi:MAG: AlpA family phage regulatory protein [Aeromicrobium sp.]|nr:AlpA family phage regulatory protein [Burkholderiales bacterium]
MIEPHLRQRIQTLINRKQLLAMVPMCERTILDMEKRGEFPRRFAVTKRLVAWDLVEVELWISERKAAAKQLAAPMNPAPGGTSGRSCRPSPAA